MTGPVITEPVPASTVALLRDVDGGVEVCMLRRPGRSSFAADAFVFPGGAVDAADGTLPEAFRIAGVRGGLGEGGLLFGGAAADTSEDDLEVRVGAAREQILRGENFTDALAEYGLVI